MSATIVITEERKVLHLVLSEEQHTPDSLLDRLVQIVSSHQELQDELSTQLAAWGGSVAALYLEDSAEDCLAAAVKKIRELQKILINPMDMAPLRRPVVVGGRLWEEWMFTLYRRQTEVCPFSRNRLPREGTAHLFAKEMIKWMEDVKKFLNLSLEEDASWFLQEATVRELDMVSLIQGFQNLGASALRREASLRLEERFAEMADSFRLSQAELVKQIEESKQHVHERFEALQKANEKEKEELRAKYEKSLAELTEKMTALEKRVQQSEMEARERKEAIAELQRNLQAARNSVQALQNQPKKKGRSCIVM